MFDIESEEILTTLSLAEAASVVRALLPQASVKEIPGRIVNFDLVDGDKVVAVVSVFKADPIVVEARYVAGAADPRCADLKQRLAAAFRDSGVAPVVAAPLSFKERFLASLAGKREYGIRIRRLSFGPPASEEAIARVERDHLGFPMPEVLRDFFAAHDGMSVFFHRVDDPSAEIYDAAVPLDVESTTPIPWNEACWDGGPLWAQIEQADFGQGAHGGFFYVGLICIPSLDQIFNTDWSAILGWPEGTWLFDAFHPFYGSALVRDDAARTLRVQPTADAGADRDAEPVALADYLDKLVQSCGTDRLVNGRNQAVRSAG